MTTSFRVCTVATQAALPSVRVLRESLRRHHDDVELAVLLIDDTDATVEADELRLVPRSVLGLSEESFARLAALCTAEELTAALQPWLVRALIADDASAVLVLSPETEVFAPIADIADIAELAEQHTVVVVPRVDAPLPDDGLDPTRADLLETGPVAPGFIAVGGNCVRLLDQWCEWASTGPPARGRPDGGDGWRSLVPTLFGAHVLRDPGCGVSAWNLHCRELRRTPTGYDVSGYPLRWFHFDGYSPDAAHLLSTRYTRPRVLLSEHPDVAELCDAHGMRLRAAGHEGKPAPYGLGVLPDGCEIDRRMRRLYAEALRRAEAGDESEPPAPFGADGASAFVAWLNEPVAPTLEPRVSRYLTRVWQESEPLRHVFPTLAGEGAEQYLSWARSPDADDYEIPTCVQPSQSDVVDLIKQRWRSRPRRTRPHGVNLVGYVNAVLGVGEVARLLAAALEYRGIPHAVVANRETASRQSVAFASGRASEAAYDLNLLCVNADHTIAAALQLGAEFFAAQRTVGVWFWEVEDFPPDSSPAFDLVDEVWVASDFVRDAIQPGAPKPVRKVPIPVVLPSVPGDVSRSQLGLPDDKFVFLFSYDFLSTAERKNPVGLIDAFKLAFGPDDGAALVLKSINGTRRLTELERVRRQAAGRRDVFVIDRYLSPEHHGALFALSDAYVSLHRSEGYGTTMATAMGLGKPVIATRYSGNLEFMDDATSYLVDYELEPVGVGCDPYPPETRWARPRLEHAAELMRHVFERPEEARQRADRAADHIRRGFSLEARSQEIAGMLDDARGRAAEPATWRRFFMEGWRAHRDRIEELPYGALDWLPDGTPVDPAMRRLLASERMRGAPPPNPERHLEEFYAWLNEPYFPRRAPVVSRYLHSLWRDRPDLQEHFPDLEHDPRSFLNWLHEHGHADTGIPYHLLPTADVLGRLDKAARRPEQIAATLRLAGQRLAEAVRARRRRS